MMVDGRPTSYRPQYAEQARKLCLLGATDEEMADFFGVCVATIYNWKHDFPDFLEAIRAGKTIADSEVANGLYDRAKGAEWIEQVPMKVKTVEYVNGKKAVEKEEIVVTPVTRRAPPDTQAASLWLRNRRGKNAFTGEWVDKVEHTHEGGEKPMVVVSDNETARRIAFALQQGLRKKESGDGDA